MHYPRLAPRFHCCVAILIFAAALSGRADDSAIHSIDVGEPLVIEAGSNVSGDTWMPAWMADGTVVSPANDTHGFSAPQGSNINFNRLTGDTPETLKGETINVMAEFGHDTEHGPDGCTWKSSGCLALDGNLYWVVGRHEYGEETGDRFKRQPAHNGTILKSTDGGKTWTPSAKDAYDHPMFGGTKFSAPYFVNYGQDGHLAVADGSDKYVYAASNNSFWDNGDYITLGRCLRSKMPDLNPGDWQYFTGGDGAQDASWNADRTKSTPIIEDVDKLGMSGATYLPAQKCYLMVCWYYPAGSGKLPDAHVKTTWNFRVASHPWGPWRSVGTHDFSPQGYYCPGICPKFSSADGSKAWVFTAGDWTNGAVYRLTGVPITIK
jgi:hypothetical protein